MARTLNNLCSSESALKSRIHEEISKIHNCNQKPDLFNGFSEIVEMLSSDDQDRHPPTNKLVQQKAHESVTSLQKFYTELFDCEATKDKTNMKATADVVVDGVVVMKGVPATTLLYLGKKLDEIRDFIQKLPTLDPAHNWTYDSNSGVYKSEESRRSKTKKVQRPIVLHPPTVEHPAQTQLITEDTVTGHFVRIEHSGAFPKDRQVAILEKVRKLQVAVNEARAEANKAEVEDLKIGQIVFDFLLK